MNSHSYDFVGDHTVVVNINQVTRKMNKIPLFQLRVKFNFNISTVNQTKTRFRISLNMYSLIKVLSASKHKTFGTIEKLRRIY